MASGPDETMITRIVWNMESLEVIERTTVPYDGPWELCKGDNSQAEMKKADALSQQQIDLQKQQFGLQQTQLGMVNPALQSIIANGGMLPAQEAAMRSSAMAQTGAAGNQAIGAINNALVARGVTGGGNAGSGDIAKNYGALEQGLAGQQASSMQNIQLAKGQGLNNAMNTALGIGGMYGSQATAAGGQAVGALGSGVTAANNADQAQGGFWGSLIGGLAGMGGSLGSAGIAKCWVAAELYGGWLAPETVAIRSWLDRTWWMLPFSLFYSAVGRRWAKWIRRDSGSRMWTKRLFDSFLRRANG